MAYNYTSEDLIRSIKIKTSLPTNDSVFPDEDILMMADEELRINTVPLLLSTNEDYYVHVDYIPLQSGVFEYEIPYRAISSKIREIGWCSSITANDYYPLNRISIDDINTQPNDSLLYFYLRGDKIVLHTRTTQGGYLAVFYPFRPNRLVATSKVGIITDFVESTITVGPNVIDTYVFTIDKAPDNFASNVEFDFIKQKSNHGVICYDKQSIAWISANNQIVFPQSLFTDYEFNGIKVGDVIALANETNIIACPTDLQPVLAQTVASQILSSLGDTENLQHSNVKLAKMENASYTLAENRVTGSAVKIANRNGLVKGRCRTNYRRW